MFWFTIATVIDLFPSAALFSEKVLINHCVPAQHEIPYRQGKPLAAEHSGTFNDLIARYFTPMLVVTKTELKESEFQQVSKTPNE